MKQIITTALAAIALCAGSAQAGVINDTGAGAFWGGDAHGYGDVIGNSTFDIHGATIERNGNELKIAIATNFAGHAGVDTWAAQGGIAYGDLFLAETWNPYGGDANHAGSNSANGTLWSYGFHLDNRFSNTGGSFKLYQLNGATNAANTKGSEAFMSCGLGVSCYYRNGQATAVNTASNTVTDTGLVGTWTVTPNAALEFTIMLSSVELARYSSYALHWGETCQNDVIEGQVDMPVPVPLPGALPLMALGLAALGMARRRR
ncbi:hypothetical protein G4G28_04575 [Massilia sp. Dwa41.01b]|uniref:VPLPA-CTERM sorting domain-containing protein n=1 Tax=unclassified Massilia TaxID=2609279 RepID=UPI00160223BD|nr:MULTISPECIES: VPLPA-CTERM sorting domain-containing protein [unclassified Massilia]QNA87924.1 hypothetical protein G4G28_04575 [Massilia sp. Dwa41.01b]QNA98827.1 hypothetical protein G4G31_08295 [Massilia sp. Se16.2.3]